MLPQISRVISLIQKNFLSVAIISFSFWLYVVSISEKDFDNPPDNLLLEAFHNGKKIQKFKFREPHTIQITPTINTTESEHLNETNNLTSNTVDKYESIIKETLNQIKEEKRLKDDDIFAKLDMESSNQTDTTRSKIHFSQLSHKTKNFYGINIKLVMDTDDICTIISNNSSILNTNSSLLLWDNLVKYKNELKRQKFLAKNNYNTSEIFLFNLIPIKQISVILFCCLIFFIIHLIHYEYENKFPLKYRIFFHCVCFFFSLGLGITFYNRFYFIGSSVILSQMILSLKYLIEEFFFINGYKEHEYDIFNLSTALADSDSSECTQGGTSCSICNSCGAACDSCDNPSSSGGLLVKLLIAFMLTVLMLFKIFYFPHFMNYMIFYSLVVYIMYISSLYLKGEVSSIFSPLRQFMFVTAGVINFIITKFHKNILKFSKYQEVQADSFYIVSDLFSLTCIAYILDFLNVQGNQANDLYETSSLDNNNELMKLINKKMNNIKDKTRDFLMEDILWVYVLVLGLMIIYIGLADSTYICFYFGFYYFKLVLKCFKKFFNLKLSRIAYGVVIFIILATNQLMSTRVDNTLMDVSFKLK